MGFIAEPNISFRFHTDSADDEDVRPDAAGICSHAAFAARYVLWEQRVLSQAWKAMLLRELGEAGAARCNVDVTVERRAGHPGRRS
ncbi:hypothetical protein [Paenibacillus xerothermodurans]|uniref:hypothetical protein n=1 Tax=Paenibacillus xerothermodurans TaxID=1977292 RepID=UPI0014027A35|nr:hypothetical protein [Paenibacillus xerothermodurans]